MPRRPRSRGGNRGRDSCLLAAAALDWRLLRGAAPFAAPPSAGRAGFRCGSAAVSAGNETGHSRGISAVALS